VAGVRVLQIPGCCITVMLCNDKKTKSAGTEAAGHRSIESLAERVRAGAGLVVVVGSRSKTAECIINGNSCELE